MARVERAKTVPKMVKRPMPFDPNKSDSDDLDYGAEAASPRARPQGRSKKSKSATRKPAKRRRERYGNSEDDIEADSDEISEEESFGEPSEEEEEVETNPRTGRSVRSVAKKPIKYEEPSEEDIEAEDSGLDPIQPTPARNKRRAPPSKKESLIVKLKIPVRMEGGRDMRPRTGSKSVTKREPTPQSHGCLLYTSPSPRD